MVEAGMMEFLVRECEVAKLQVVGEVSGCGWRGRMDEAL